MDYQLRVDGSWSVISNWVEENVCVHFTSVIVYEHPATSTKSVHCHALLLQSDRKEDIIRNILKGSPDSIIGKDEKQRKRFALATKAGRRPNWVAISLEGIRYFSKGKYDPVYVKNIEESVIKSHKALGYDVVKNTTKWAKNGTVEITGEDGDTKRVTVYEMQEEVAKRIEYNKIYETKEILLEIKDVMRKYKHKTHMYDMMNWYDSVRNLSRNHFEQFLDEVEQKINSRQRI